MLLAMSRIVATTVAVVAVTSLLAQSYAFEAASVKPWRVILQQS
jgi:hypothetical protein